MSRYTFVEAASDWPTEFAVEAARLRNLLPDLLVDVHHIGSTSVPGLAAKPIIDLLPVVRDAGRMDALTVPLEAAGYIGRGEFGLPGRRYFFKDHEGVRTHNLHFYPARHPDVVRHLSFCAYLRTHADAAAEYAALKRDAFTRHPDNIHAYSDFKNDWIKRVERIAIVWYGEGGNGPEPYNVARPGCG